LLGAELLGKLRNYYRQYRPKEWLFEGKDGHAREAVPQKACNRAEQESGVGKRVTPHVLRPIYISSRPAGRLLFRADNFTRLIIRNSRSTTLFG